MLAASHPDPFLRLARLRPECAYSGLNATSIGKLHSGLDRAIQAYVLQPLPLDCRVARRGQASRAPGLNAHIQACLCTTIGKLHSSRTSSHSSLMAAASALLLHCAGIGAASPRRWARTRCLCFSTLRLRLCDY